MNKTNFKTKILNFITFGYITRKAKQIVETNNEKIETSTDIGIDIDKLISYLGGLKNIVDVSATITTLKVKFLNRNLIDNDMIKNLGAKGIIIGESTATIVFGNWAKELEKQILNRKTRNNHEK